MPATRSDADPTRRPTKGERTRSMLVTEAATLFASRGYDATSVREIADRCGVNPALINIYFGSKQQLFREIMTGALDRSDLMTGELANLGWKWARATVQGGAADEGRQRQSQQALLLMLRSATSADAAAIVRDAINDRVVHRVAAMLPGPDAEQRAALIATYLLCFAMMQRVVGVTGLGKGDPERLVEHLARAVQDCVDGPDSGGAPPG